MMRSRVPRPPDSVVRVATEILRVRPDENGLRGVCDADIQLVCGYRSRRSVEMAMQAMSDRGLLEVGVCAKSADVGLGVRQVRVIDSPSWATILPFVELAEVWS